MNAKITAALTLAHDFTATVQAITDAHKEQCDVLNAVRERIATEKRRAEERKTELQGTVGDGSRSATVRSLAQHELDALATASYGPTMEERAVFDAATQAGVQAVADLRQTREALRAALADARAELETVREETVGRVDTDLLERWVAGKQDEFDRL